MLLRTNAAVMMLFIGVSSTWAGETNPASPPLQLSVNLIDGSRIVGTPSTNAVRFVSSLGEFNVPFERMKQLTIGSDHETVALDLSNGDHLTGVVTPDPLLLTATWGKVRIGMEVVHGIRVIVNTESGLSAEAKQSLVLHYTFDKEEDGRTADLSGKTNDGQVRGGTWVRDGNRGGYMQFDGNQTLVNAGHGQELSITRDLSISAWLRKSPKTFGDQLQPILGKDDGPDWPGRSYMLYLCDNADNHFVAFNYGVAAGGTSGGHDIRAYDPRISDGQWHHVAVVHVTGAGNRIYVDGKCLAEDKEGSPLPSNPNTDTIVGKTQAWEPWFFFGAMDDVMVFNRALSADDIKALYKGR